MPGQAARRRGARRRVGREHVEDQPLRHHPQQLAARAAQAPRARRHPLDLRRPHFRFEYGAEQQTVSISKSTTEAALKAKTPEQVASATKKVASVKKSPRAPDSNAKKENAGNAPAAAANNPLAGIAAAAAAAAARREAAANAAAEPQPLPMERASEKKKTPLGDSHNASVLSAMKARRKHMAGESATPSPHSEAAPLSAKKSSGKKSSGKKSSSKSNKSLGVGEAMPFAGAAALADAFKDVEEEAEAMMQEDEPEPVAPEPEPSAEEMLPPVLMAAIAKRQSGAKPSPMPSPKIVKPVASPAPKPTGGKSTPKSSAKKMNATFAPILPGSAPGSRPFAPAPATLAMGTPEMLGEGMDPATGEDLGVPVHEEPVQKLSDLSIRPALPAVFRQQIDARRRSSAASHAAGTPVLAAPEVMKAPTPAKMMASPGLEALENLPKGLRSAIKARRSSTEGPAPSPFKKIVSFEGRRTSAGPSPFVAQGDTTMTRFPAAVGAPPNTPAAGLPLNTAMPVAIGALNAALGEPAADKEEEPRRRSVKFNSSSALVGAPAGLNDAPSAADGPSSERKRKPLRASWDQTPGMKEGALRRSSKTPKAGQSKTPNAGKSGSLLDQSDDHLAAMLANSAAPNSKASSIPSSAAYSAAASSAAHSFANAASAGPVPSTGGAYSAARRASVESAVAHLQMELTDLTPNGAAVVSTLLAAPTAAGTGRPSMDQAVNDAFSPNAAEVVGGILRRPSMMEGNFSPMKAVRSSTGSMRAVGTFSVKPSPAKSANKEAEAMEEDEATTEPFASPQPKGGRINSHVKFGDANGTPKVVRGENAEEGGLWVASVGYNAAGESSLTLHDKVHDANVEASEEWTEEEWAEWEAEEWAAWEAENMCYPWQFEGGEEELGQPSSPPIGAMVAIDTFNGRASLMPAGGRFNTHMRFDEDDDDGEEDEEESDSDDDSEEEAEAFGESGVLSAKKGMPTPRRSQAWTQGGLSAMAKLALQSPAKSGPKSASKTLPSGKGADTMASAYAKGRRVSGASAVFPRIGLRWRPRKHCEELQIRRGGGGRGV